MILLVWLLLWYYYYDYIIMTSWLWLLLEWRIFPSASRPIHQDLLPSSSLAFARTLRPAICCQQGGSSARVAVYRSKDLPSLDDDTPLGTRPRSQFRIVVWRLPAFLESASSKALESALWSRSHLATSRSQPVVESINSTSDISQQRTGRGISSPLVCHQGWA